MRRYFYLVYVAAFGACAAFAVNAWGHWLAPDESKQPRVRHVPPPPAPRVVRSKDGNAVANRNMFCSSCDGLPPLPPEGEPARSALPLYLIATNVTGDTRSFATVRHRDSLRVGAYRQGDSIPDGGVVEQIRGGYIVVLNASNGRAERIDLIAVATTSAAPKVSSSNSAAAGEYSDRIAKLDDTHYEVDRGLIEDLIADPRKAQGARVSLTKQGVRLFAIRAGSPAGRLGLRNGDTIVDINGMSATSADKLLEIYGVAKSANNLSITVKRRGKEQTLHYSIR